MHSLGIVVPAQDEDPTIAGTIHALLAVDWGMPCEVLVVDDGSRRPVVERLIEGGVDTERVRVITLPRRSGRGAAIRRGASELTSSLLAFHDGDGEYLPGDLRRMLTFVLDRDADVVIGSRHLGPGRAVMQYWRAVGHRIVTWSSNAMTDLNLSDATSGSVVLTRALWQRLDVRADGFDIDVEMVAAIARARARVWEVPVTYAGRLRVDGRKSRRRDVFRRLRRVIDARIRGDRLLRKEWG